MDVLKHFIENFEATIGLFAFSLKVCFEAISIGTILFGLITSGRLAFLLLRRPNTYHYTRVRARFGRALALALEFQLAADILATAVFPSFESLGQLALIAVIRTGLNFFLTRELEELHRLEEAVLIRSPAGNLSTSSEKLSTS